MEKILLLLAVFCPSLLFGQIGGRQGISGGNKWVDWVAGDVVYVPTGADIQTYIDAADAGSTIKLGAGVYTLTDTIEIDKELNIIGQGSSGFVTVPVTASHGTLITSETAAVVAFQINNDNVRISDLSINLTGAGSQAISTAADLQGVVFQNIDVIVNSTGACQGFTVLSSDAVLRDLTFYITSSDGTASGMMLTNTADATRDAVVDCFNVTGTVVGGATYAYALAAVNNDDTYTLTLNLSNSVVKALAGTALDIGVISHRTDAAISIVNSYFSTLEGDDWDAYQTTTNELNLGGSIVVNNKISGTVTYRATMVSQAITADTVGVNGNLHVTGNITAGGDCCAADYAITDTQIPLKDYWVKTLQLNRLPAFENRDRNNVMQYISGLEETNERLLRYIVEMDKRITELEKK